LENATFKIPWQVLQLLLQSGAGVQRWSAHPRPMFSDPSSSPVTFQESRTLRLCYVALDVGLRPEFFFDHCV